MRKSDFIIIIQAILLFRFIPSIPILASESPEGNGIFHSSQAVTGLLFTPTYDARVKRSSPQTNYGDKASLKIEQGKFKSYLKFNIVGINGSIHRALLRMVVLNESDDGGSVYQVANEYAATTIAWREDSLNWDNAPPVNDNPLSTVDTVHVGETVEFDVTSAIIGDGVYSFALKSGSFDQVEYSSKEGANPPQLLIQLNSLNLNITAEGSGRVDLEPAGGIYGEGTVVKLTPKADSGWAFIGWQDDLSGWQKPANLTMDSEKNVTAVFTELPVPLFASGIWASPEEINMLPMSGVAWENIKADADKPTGPPNLSDKDDSVNVRVMAKALVYARTGQEIYRTDVINACMAAIGTEAGGRTLALGRELMAYVVAAELVALPAAKDSVFRAWLPKALSEVLDGNSLRATSEVRPNNWGLHAGASRAAIARYLGDTDELARTASVFKGWLGDRASYSDFKYGELDWQANPEAPVGINPKGSVRQGHSIDGVLPDEQRRGGAFSWPPPKENYAYEGLQGALAQAVILYRAGYDVWNWEDQALLRAFNWLYNEIDFPAKNDDTWQPHIVNHFYNANFPAPIPSIPGKNMGWTDWLYGSRFALNVETGGEGSGQVVLHALGKLNGNFLAVEVKAMPNPNNFFTGWSGDLNAAANPDTIVLDSNKTVRATFAPQRYTLSITIQGSGEVATVPFDTVYNVGTKVKLDATPARGWIFSGWQSDSVSLDNPLEVKMDSDKQITAIFTELPQGKFPFFGSVEVSANFEFDGTGRNLDTIAFWEAPDSTNSLMFVTAKSNSLVDVWQYPFVDNELTSLTHPSFANSVVNGVAVDQENDGLFVSIANPASTVSVFSLPALDFVRKFNKDGVDLKASPNLALLKLKDGSKRVYVSADRVVYIHDATTGDYLGEFQPHFGLETMASDDFYQVLYIPTGDNHTGIYTFNPGGTSYTRYNANNFGRSGIFQGDAEGILTYRCLSRDSVDSGCGFIVVVDQLPSQTEFEFFDRQTWRYLGQLKIAGVAKTNGIASLQKSLPDYPLGLFAAVNKDSSIVGMGWDTIFAATGLDCDYCNSERRTFHPTDDAYVNSSKATKNFGNKTQLEVITADFAKRISYLKFDLGDVNGRVIKATLHLQVTQGGEAGGSIYLVSNDYFESTKPWTEGSLDWTNAPIIEGDPITNLGTVNAGDSVEFDVTQAISGAGVYSFAITDAPTEMIFSSKESARSPMLIIDVAGSSVNSANQLPAGLQKSTYGMAQNERIIELKSNYPNPFNLETTIEYFLPVASEVKLEVYNLRGQVVRTLVDGFQTAGFKKNIWNGRNEFGKEVASGVYFIRLAAQDKKFVRKIILQK